MLLLRSWIWDGCFPALPVQLYQVLSSSLLHIAATSFPLEFVVQDIISSTFVVFFPGLVTISLYKFSFAREHTESKWKWHSSLVRNIIFSCLWHSLSLHLFTFKGACNCPCWYNLGQIDIKLSLYVVHIHIIYTCLPAFGNVILEA